MGKDYVLVASGPDPWDRKEILMKKEDAELPTDVPAGSTAYTADMSVMKMFDGEAWKIIGGDE